MKSVKSILGYTIKTHEWKDNTVIMQTNWQSSHVKHSMTAPMYYIFVVQLELGVR